MDFGKLKEQAAIAAEKAKNAANNAATSFGKNVADVASSTSENLEDASQKASKLIVENSQKFAKYFSESNLVDKIKKVAAVAGITVIYPVLILWKLFNSGDVPAEKKAIIIAALGYFIFPMDLIADIIPGIGYADDAAALMTALKMTLANINQDLTDDVKKNLHEWFGDFDEKSLETIDSVIKMGDKTIKYIKK